MMEYTATGGNLADLLHPLHESTSADCDDRLAITLRPPASRDDDPATKIGVGADLAHF
jgi:hypothetical protein